MSQTCKTCRWWVQDKGDHERGECHRYPPTFRQPSSDMPSGGLMFAGTLDIDFCGEWSTACQHYWLDTGVVIDTNPAQICQRCKKCGASRNVIE